VKAATPQTPGACTCFNNENLVVEYEINVTIPSDSSPTGILLFVERGFSGEWKGKHFLSAAGKRSQHLQSRRGGCRSGSHTSVCSLTSQLLSRRSQTALVQGHSSQSQTGHLSQPATPPAPSKYFVDQVCSVSVSNNFSLISREPAAVCTQILRLSYFNMSYLHQSRPASIPLFASNLHSAILVACGNKTR